MSGFYRGFTEVLSSQSPITNYYQSPMKLSSIILIIGLVILAAGSALSVAKIQPWADYVLVAGAVVVVIRGFIRNHERDDNNQKQS